MNNPHNMWTNRDQTVIYQTQWFGNDLTVFNRITGKWIRNTPVGSAPAHVMTRTDTDQVHVSLNGGGEVVELSPLAVVIDRHIRTQNDALENPAQPHAHWMSFDAKIMVTPNSNTADSTRIDIPSGNIVTKIPTGTLPIASSIMPDASKYYVSNYLDSTISCISIQAGACKADKISLLLGGRGWATTTPTSLPPLKRPSTCLEFPSANHSGVTRITGIAGPSRRSEAPAVSSAA